MKTGDLVKIIHNGMHGPPDPGEAEWVGIIVGWHDGCPLVWWNEDYPEELEYTDQLKVINESR